MRQDKKIAHYKKQTEGLKNIIHALRVENEILKLENKTLANVNSSCRSSIDSSADEMKSLRDSFSTRLKELDELRDKYKTAIASVNELKKKYRKDMDKFMSGVKKRS